MDPRKTYTTCSHEIEMNGSGRRQVYWAPEKDRQIMNMTPSGWVDEDHMAYVWGGQTGAIFWKMQIDTGFEDVGSLWERASERGRERAREYARVGGG
jgi:hypothetical protein